MIAEPNLSECPCKLIPAKNNLTIEDIGSHRGVYIRIEGEIELHERTGSAIARCFTRIKEIDKKGSAH